MIFAPTALFMSLAFSVQAAPPPMAKVVTQVVRESENSRRVITPAKVEARVQSTVSSDIEGHVTRIRKPLGSMVKVDEVILFIENKEPGYTYAAVPIRSPINGVITQFQTSLMTKVTKGDRLFTVIDPKSLKIMAEIASADLPHVKLNSQGSFKTDLNGSDKGFQIRLTGISPTVDPRTGTAPAEMEFVPAKGVSLPAIGTLGHSVFEINHGHAILIPESALTYLEGKPFVRIVTKNKIAVKKKIELGEQKESLFTVKSGLDLGEELILRSSQSLKDGEAVEVEKVPEVGGDIR